MQALSLCFRIAAIFWSVVSCCGTSFAQGAINPFHLFNTGLNMGFLNGHFAHRTAGDQYQVWADNAAAEWIASWPPGFVEPITPDISNPFTANNQYVTHLITSPAQCMEPYIQADLTLYRTAELLGRSIVQTGTACSDCLSLDLQRAALELRSLSSILRKPIYAELSNGLMETAKNLEMKLSAEEAKIQNAGLFGLINSTITFIQADLPDEMIYCAGQKTEDVKPGAHSTSTTTEAPTTGQTSEPVSTSVDTQTAKESDRDRQATTKGSRDRAFILKAGFNSGSLKDDGEESQTYSGSGFQVGFDMYRGNPVFLALGLKFFRNSAGEELMVPYPGQTIDTDSYYIQGFTFGAGLGGYVYQNDDVKASLTGKLNYIITHAINGNLTSVGDTSVTDGAFHLEIGAGLAYKLLFAEISYELGLTEALESGNEKYKYRLVNFSIGIRIQ